MRRAYVWLAVLFALVVIVFSVVPISNALRDSLKDYRLWYKTGQRVLDGADLYPLVDGEFEFIYPPPAALILAPISVFGQLPLVVILGLVNTAIWITSIFLSVYLVTGRAWRQSPWLYAVPTFCTAPYVWSMYLGGQPNLFLLACLLGAFICLRHQRPWATGALVAFATAIKAFPVLAVIYLVYRRHWKAVLWTLAFLVFFFVLVPTPIRGFQRNIADLKTWATGMGFKYEADSFAQRTAKAYSYKNQSLMGLANRLLRPVTAKEIDGRAVTVNVANLSFNQVNAIIVAVALALCLFYITSMPRRTARTAESDAIELAMLLLLILVFSPLTYQYFLVWLLYPLTVVLNFALVAPRPSRERNIMFTCFVITCTLLVLQVAFPRSVAWRVEAYGNNLLATLVLFGLLGWKLRRLRRLC